MSASSYNPAASSSGKVSYFPSDARAALSAWTRAKEAIRGKIKAEDFQSFVRPMYLAGLLSSRFLLIAIPPNRRVIERARAFHTNLAAFIEREGYGFAGFTAYPSDDALIELYERQFDANSFRPFLELMARKRIEKLLARREREDRRDRKLIA